MIKDFSNFLQNKKILILGYGKEGISTFNFIKALIPIENISIADFRHPSNFQLPANFDTSKKFYYGEDYLQCLPNFDLIIKSPGISLKNINIETIKHKISSQTDIFLKYFSKQIVGVTGTKGKSTTSSLINHILSNSGFNSVLAGNIGLPFFDIIENINENTYIVCELSSHQLEFVSYSPHISVLLNLFQEHLDHYNSFKDYQLAKYNIARFQKSNDYFIYNADDNLITNLVNENSPISNIKEFSRQKQLNSIGFIDKNNLYISDGNKIIKIFDKTNSKKLLGKHNDLNILAASMASYIIGVDCVDISKAICSFEPLHHRIEFVGTINNIDFYNDSIATIPEASMNAIEALERVNTIIIGGHDRGIDYDDFVNYLIDSKVENIIFIDKAGERILQLFKNYGKKSERKQKFPVNTINEAINIALTFTKQGSICLLSPAAASYGMFKNFEERGEVYKSIIQGIVENKKAEQI